MKRTRIYVIEDNRILRDGITSILNGQEDLRVVGSSSGNNNIALKIRETKAQVLLMDLGLRNLNSVTIIRSIAEHVPSPKVIGMGLIPSQLDIVEFVEAGASGFILKDASEKDFLWTIRSVASGTNVLPPQLTGSLFSHVLDHALKAGKSDPVNGVRMTKREREIIALIADAMTNKEIAQHLNIATYTVKSHVHNILEKLALHSRLQISVYSQNAKVE
jgi:DNA-binding NarL/FixJ family response regulator